MKRKSTGCFLLYTGPHKKPRYRGRPTKAPEGNWKELKADRLDSRGYEISST